MDGLQLAGVIVGLVLGVPALLGACWKTIAKVRRLLSANEELEEAQQKLKESEETERLREQMRDALAESDVRRTELLEMFSKPLVVVMAKVIEVSISRSTRNLITRSIKC